MSERQTESMSPSAEDMDKATATPENQSDLHIPGKPGRKKNPNTAAARRDQNRVAQREFRLRKQQKIRDLEARVELLSGDKDETFARLRVIVQDLMLENSKLRTLLRDLSKFIGEGIGGHIQRIGWEFQQFQAFLDKSETDVAFDSFINSKTSVNASQPTSNDSTAAKSTSANGDSSLNKKRKRTMDEETTPGGDDPSPFNHTSSSADSLAFSALLDPFTAGASTSYPGAPLPNLGAAGPSRSLSTHEATMGFSAPTSTPPNSALFTPSFTPSLNVYGAGPSTRSASNSITSIQNIPTFPQQQPQGAESDDMLLSRILRENQTVMSAQEAKKHEAGRLIRYHLDNFRRNPMYCLPRSLNPTLVQKTIPHQNIIDAIIYPELRDRMILMKDRFSLAEVIAGFFFNTTLHEDDVLNHANWEIHEPWLKQYAFLVDENVLVCCNRWRKERGEPDLTIASLASESN